VIIEILGFVPYLLTLLVIFLVNARLVDFFEFSKETVRISEELSKIQVASSELEMSLNETDEVLLGVQEKVANLMVKEGLAL